MDQITKIDPNFKVETKLELDNVHFYSALDEPFSLHGVFYQDGRFRRMPKNVAETVSASVSRLHTHTAGGRIRFKTDSAYIAIKAVMPQIAKMSHFALTGSAGFDLYFGNEEIFVKTFAPPYSIENGFESVIKVKHGEMRQYTINFPLYSGISELYIGLEDTASLLPPDPYKIEKPIVFYGSSITQGGCASRPGNSYESRVSRALSAEFINLGFSGSCRAEEEMAHYIKTLDMSAFVYDYDHNSRNPEYLASTHQKFFQLVREAKPELPILILSRPEAVLKGSALVSKEIIEKTFTDAKAEGDQNVYFLDGPKLMKLAGTDGTVDGCHPNDLGFYSMAEAVIAVLKPVLCK